jgi:hypothetical protein
VHFHSFLACVWDIPDIPKLPLAGEELIKLINKAAVDGDLPE